MSSSRIPSRTLNDGSTIPLIGFGTGTALFKRSNLDAIDRGTVDAIKQAIQLGYTHLDGAELYNTEAEIGIAIQEADVPREDLFVTTKVIHNIHDIPRAIDASLRKLQLRYVDLFLIHSPWFAASDAELQAAWAEMEKVRRAGKARSIGVSNYRRPHLEATLATATIPPTINQLEFHPYLQRENLLSWAESKDIALAAYSSLVPITKGRPGPCDDILAELAKKYRVSEEAVILRWCIDQGVVAITTSSKEERLRDYLGAATFELTEEEVEMICKRGHEKHFRVNNFMHHYPPDDRA